MIRGECSDEQMGMRRSSVLADLRTSDPWHVSALERERGGSARRHGAQCRLAHPSGPDGHQIVTDGARGWSPGVPIRRAHPESTTTMPKCLATRETRTSPSMPRCRCRRSRARRIGTSQGRPPPRLVANVGVPTPFANFWRHRRRQARADPPRSRSAPRHRTAGRDPLAGARFDTHARRTDPCATRRARSRSVACPPNFPG